MKFKYGKIFLLGFGSFGFSLLWIVYNAFVPLLLDERFSLQPGVIGLFMTLDNIAALLIQPSIGALSDRLHTPIGRRMPFILIGAPIAALAVVAALVLFIFIKEPKVPQPLDEEQPGPWKSIKAIGQGADKSVLWILLAMFA